MKLILFLLISLPCIAQKPAYKERDVCIETEFHKGKVNHGNPYCVAWATVREHLDGRKDTVSWMLGGKSKMYIGDEYEKYKKLSERGKYIVDSLKEDGITQLQSSYLTYEPIYMKAGRKTEQLWNIEDENVVVYKYMFWKSNKGHGIRLINSFEVK